METRNPTGYSGTPLAKKLGIKEAHVIFLYGAPENFVTLLDPLPAKVQFTNHPDSATDLAHVFATQRGELERYLRDLRKILKPDAILWVSWPKKASKVPSTLSDNVIRELALPLGFVDIKVCAVTEVWSGLKLVLRKELR